MRRNFLLILIIGCAANAPLAAATAFSETDAPYRFINAGVVATMAAETRVRVERHDDGCAFIWSQHHVEGVRRIAWFAPNDTSKPVTTRTMLSLIGVSDPALHAWRIRAYERAKHDRHYADLPDVADEMPARFTLADYPEVVRGRSVRYGCRRDTCTGGPSFRVNRRRFDTLWIDGVRYRYEGIPEGRAAVHEYGAFAREDEAGPSAIASTEQQPSNRWAAEALVIRTPRRTHSFSRFEAYIGLPFIAFAVLLVLGAGLYILIAEARINADTAESRLSRARRALDELQREVARITGTR